MQKLFRGKVCIEFLESYYASWIMLKFKIEMKNFMTRFCAIEGPSNVWYKINSEFQYEFTSLFASH